MRRIVCVLMTTACLATLMCAGGCEGSLFPDDQPRTQFERYDRLRGRYTPTEQRNAYGQTEPALRARLDPNRQ